LEIRKLRSLKTRPAFRSAQISPQDSVAFDLIIFESSVEKTVRNRKIMENIIYLVQIATAWTYEGPNGSAL
jgi:hypothetical protein